MLKIRDSFILAKTKFRIRRIRLAISVFVVAIFVAGVFVGFSAIDRAGKSLNEFSSKGISDKFIAIVGEKNDHIWDLIQESPPEVVARAKQLYAEENKRLADEHRRRGEEFVPDSSQSPIYSYENNFLETVETLNHNSKFALQSLQEYLDKNFSPTPEEKALAKIKNYNPKNISTSEINSLDGSLFLPEKSIIEALKNDRNNSYYQRFSRQTFYDKNLVAPFLLDDFHLEKGEIPVIVEYHTAEEILKYKFEGEKSPQNFYAHIQKIRENINKNPLELCLRNQADIQEITDSYRKNQDKDSKVKYNLPKGCEGVSIASDKRTRQEKTADEKLLAELKKSADYREPLRQKIKFRVVGVVPNSGATDYAGIEGMLYALVSPGVQSDGVIVPREIFEQNVDSLTKKLFEKDEKAEKTLLDPVRKAYFVEFSSSEEMKNFVQETNCDKKYCPDFMMTVIEYSNNSRTLEEFKELLRKILTGIAIFLAILTIVIIYVVINRIMVDSRRETAVFRAIGYSRLEIVQIYVAYLVIYSGLVAIVASVLSLLVAAWMNGVERDASWYFSAFFSLKDWAHFEIFDFDLKILASVLPILGVALVASWLPLVLNSRRSPLKNLRME